MAEKQRWGQDAQMGDAGTANQTVWCCDGVLGSRAVVSRRLRRQLGKRQPGSQGVKPHLKWAMAHFPRETNQRLFSLIIRLTSSHKALHALPLSSAVLALTACHCRFVFSGSWNPCTASSCHWGLHQCHKDATQLLYFTAFSRRSLMKKSALRNTM